MMIFKAFHCWILLNRIQVQSQLYTQKFYANAGGNARVYSVSMLDWIFFGKSFLFRYQGLPITSFFKTYGRRWLWPVLHYYSFKRVLLWICGFFAIIKLKFFSLFLAKKNWFYNGFNWSLAMYKSPKFLKGDNLIR